MSWLIALVILAFFIVFHELGHFLVARACGVKVEVFSLGFGKRLLSFEYKGTLYALSAIPLGGYVQLKGQQEAFIESSATSEVRESKQPLDSKQGSVCARSAAARGSAPSPDTKFVQQTCNNKIILLINGGDKSKQSKDIEKAQELLEQCHVERTAQPLVRSEQNDGDPPRRPLLGQRGTVLQCRGRNAPQQPVQLIPVRPGVEQGVLRLPQTGGGNHFHRTRYFLGRTHGIYSSLQFSCRCHGLTIIP